ncbi:LysR family transcriptional regulator [Thermopolyspora sp. NPDC052614]|uniref:LysR family transcriptional regulator n=1 Tax=Thermopolyspora sp. NPDC052614 TaxID=3155682 RepID=UPI003446B84B
MELRALRYFIAVAEELHFGRAAERLNIAQPAVSQQVARLERELGVRLLDRSPRTVRLTDAGRRVLDAAQDVLKAADRVRVVAHEVAAVVRIGTGPGLARRLERGIDALREYNSAFEVVLVDLPIESRLAAIRRGDLHIALARGIVTAPGLLVLPVWSEPLHVVVSARHPLADRDVVTVGDMADDVLRMPSRDNDAPLHDAITAALEPDKARLRFGRPTGTVQDTVIEVGSNPRSWALFPAEQIAATGATRVRSIPLDPPLTIGGSVILPTDVTPYCAEAIANAFRDTPTTLNGHDPRAPRNGASRVPGSRSR